MMKFLRLALSLVVGAVVGLFLYEVVDAGLVWSVMVGVFTWETLQPVPWSWSPGSSWGPAGCTFNEGAHFPKGFDWTTGQDPNVTGVVILLKYAVTAAVGVVLLRYTDHAGFPSLEDLRQNLSLGWVYLAMPAPLTLDYGRRRLTKIAQSKSAAGWFPHLRVDADSDVS